MILFFFFYRMGIQVLVAAVVSAAIGQLTKPFTSTVLYGKKFDLKAALQAGGFPSTHSSVIFFLFIYNSSIIWTDSFSR